MLADMPRPANRRPLALVMTVVLGLCMGLPGCRQEAPTEPTPPASPEGPASVEEPPAPATPESVTEEAVAGEEALATEQALADASASAPPESPPAEPAANPDESSALPDLSGWNTADGHLGQISLSWLPVGHDEIPRNVECELDVVVLADGAPVTGANLRITGYMPAHRHGLVQLPLVEEQGNGAYRVSGLLLHMRGDWELRFTVVADGKMETVSFELVL
jgi:hypothetical protein